MVLGIDSAHVEIALFWSAVIGESLMVIGALLAIFGWRQLHQAVRDNTMAQTGLYRYIRHPQYTGFFLFLLGSFINWPTIPAKPRSPSLSTPSLIS